MKSYSPINLLQLPEDSWSIIQLQSGFHHISHATWANGLRSPGQGKKRSWKQEQQLSLLGNTTSSKRYLWSYTIMYVCIFGKFWVLKNFPKGFLLYLISLNHRNSPYWNIHTGEEKSLMIFIVIYEGNRKKLFSWLRYLRTI